MKIHNYEEYNCTWLDHSPHSPKQSITDVNLENKNQENIATLYPQPIKIMISK